MNIPTHKMNPARNLLLRLSVVYLLAAGATSAFWITADFSQFPNLSLNIDARLRLAVITIAGPLSMLSHPGFGMLLFALALLPALIPIALAFRHRTSTNLSYLACVGVLWWIVVGLGVASIEF